MAQVFEFGAVADENAEVEEVACVRGAQVETVAVGEMRNGHGDAAITILPRLEVVDRRLAGAGVADMAGGVAVPLLHLGKERCEIGVRPVAVTTPAEQNAGAKGRVEAQHFRLRADRRSLVGRSQDAGSLERSEPSRLPLVSIGSDHRQARGCVRVGKDRCAQPLRVRLLFGDELIAAECRGGGDDVETERHRQRFETGDMFAVDPRQELAAEIGGDAVEIGNPAIEEAERLPFRMLHVEPRTQAAEVVRQPLTEARVGLQPDGRSGETATCEVESVARGEVVTVAVVDAVEPRPGDVAAADAQRRGRTKAQGVAGGVRGRAVGLASERAGKHEIGQGQASEQIRAVAHLGHADGEVDVRRIQVAQALQRDAVGRTITGSKAARAADGDRHFRFDRWFDEKALRLGHALAVGVEDGQVVEPGRQAAAVEDGTDVAAVENLPAVRLGFEHPGPREPDQRCGMEM
ncbi:MAG: hypothetical protein AW07_04181 [Candidatus Accumulibacter sp. SK-11]|nr:MAG: hypothetical protein AW07_04181 [Candidatus Accumulibacter sp. SK-11]